jgi:hypothetical protein
VKRKYILPILLLIQIIFIQIIAFFPEVIERFYSNGLYVFISKILRTILGGIPFSVGDLMYGIGIVYIFISIYKTQKNRIPSWRDIVLKCTSFLSVLYFLFHFLWAFNYYRLPLFEKMNMQREYSNADLFAFTEKLISKTNAVQLAITRNKNLKVSTPYSQTTVFKMSQKGFYILALEYPFFEYKTPSIKKSLFSFPLTYMGFGGYLNPFTNEAQVNNKLPMYGFSNVVCHEMAHQIGFASESECNFIGFLAGIKNEDLYFQYAAYTNALRYCMANIGNKDLAEFKILKAKINPGILANYKESDFFWKQYDTFIDKGFHVFYDQFLKFNQQKEGVESYSKFVDLMVNYYKNKAL